MAKTHGRVPWKSVIAADGTEQQIGSRGDRQVTRTLVLPDGGESYYREECSTCPSCACAKFTASNKYETKRSQFRKEHYISGDRAEKYVDDDQKERNQLAKRHQLTYDPAARSLKYYAGTSGDPDERRVKAEKHFDLAHSHDIDDPEHEKELRKAIQLDPNYLDAHGSLASVLEGRFLSSGDSIDAEKAKAQLLITVQTHRDFPVFFSKYKKGPFAIDMAEMHIFLGKHHTTDKEWEKAEFEFLTGLKIGSIHT